MKRSREPDGEESISIPTSSDDTDGPATLELDRPRSKITEIDSPEETNALATMACLLHKDRLTFNSYDEYESHYNKEHLNRCLQCKKNFPSPHLLSVHIEDSHDSFVRVKRDKGEHTYSCFVEGCERKCATPDKRRRHLIDKHMFPKSFFFAVTRDGIDGRRSLLQDGGHRHRRKSSVSTKKESIRKSSLAEAATFQRSNDKTEHNTDAQKSTAESLRDGDKMGQEVKPPPDVDMDDLAGAMSSLTFVPSSVRFGRGGRAGFSRR